MVKWRSSTNKYRMRGQPAEERGEARTETDGHRETHSCGSVKGCLKTLGYTRCSRIVAGRLSVNDALSRRVGVRVTPLPPPPLLLPLGDDSARSELNCADSRRLPPVGLDMWRDHGVGRSWGLRICRSGGRWLVPAVVERVVTVLVSCLARVGASYTYR